VPKKTFTIFYTLKIFVATGIPSLKYFCNTNNVLLIYIHTLATFCNPMNYQTKFRSLHKGLPASKIGFIWATYTKWIDKKECYRYLIYNNFTGGSNTWLTHCTFYIATFLYGYLLGLPQYGARRGSHTVNLYLFRIRISHCPLSRMTYCKTITT
jgi:hypothetical protein